MLIGRKRELEILNGLYNSNSLKLAVITGERGIGKTALLRQFARHKTAAYFCVRQGLENVNKSAWCAELREHQLAAEKFTQEWDALLEELCKKACGEKMVLMLDDAQYLKACFPCFLNALEELLAKYSSKLRLTVIFAGAGNFAAQLTFLKKSFLRPAALINMQPLLFLEAEEFLRGFERDARVLLYGVTGGYPCYLRLLKPEQTVKENLYNLFFSRQGALLQEPRHILAAKLREPAAYNSILCSVACGALRLNEIAAAIGMECNKTSKYISALLKLNLLIKIVPVTESGKNKQHKKTYYRLKNTMLEFWYQFVFPYLSLIAVDKGAQALRVRALPKLAPYCAGIFTDICMQHCLMLRQRGDFAFNFQFLGHYWDNKILPEDKLYLAYSGGRACYIVCDWGGRKTDADRLREMQAYHLESGFKEAYYLLFSQKGFTDKLLKYSADSSNVRLISLQYLR